LVKDALREKIKEMRYAEAAQRQQSIIDSILKSLTKKLTPLGLVCFRMKIGKFNK